jgi:hypothetical protein
VSRNSGTIAALPAPLVRPAQKGVESILVVSRQYFRSRVSLFPVAWVVVGVVVAAVQDYFDSLGTTGRVLTAAAAVLLWPILLFGFDITISR